MRIILPLLLILTHTTALSTVLTFPPNNSTCTGGIANDAHLHPPKIICTSHNNHWRCVSNPLHDAFLTIHDTTITCTLECTLEYNLDFTPLAVFTIAICVTLVAGVLLAVAMYLAVVKTRGSGRMRLSRPGYGTFGGRLYVVDQSDSMKDLLECDGEGEQVLPIENGKLENGERKIEWVENIYFG